MEAPNLVQFENGAYFDLGEFSNLTLNQMNFSGGSAALVDTYQSKRIFAKWSIFCSSFEKLLLFLFFLPLFFVKSFSAFSSHFIEGGEEALFCGLTHSKDRKTVHLQIQSIILHYITLSSPLILFFCKIYQVHIVFSQKFVHLPKVGCPFHFLHFFRQKVHPWVRK